MEVSAANLIALQRTYNALFRQSLEGAAPLWSMVAMEAMSTHKQEVYQWLGRVPQMREWVDEKVVQGLSGFQYTITNLDYEMTIGVDRNDIEDDSLGLYPARFQEMGQKAQFHPDKLLSAARIAGTSTVCYDNVNFYATTHSEGSSGAQSNLLSGSGVAVADLSDDFYASRAALMKYKDDKGEPFIEPAVLVAASMNNAAPFIVTCHPDLWGAFDVLFNSQLLSNSTNTLYRAARIIPDSRLTDANDWYLDFAGGIIKPFIKQTRKVPTLVSLTDPNNTESVFNTRVFKYGVESRGAIAYGLWQYSVKTTNA
jgi:phage major head subunit gpT-like protein